MQQLSAGIEIVLCRIEEHVMASSAESWSNGVQVWALSHHGENGPHDLDCSGTPPDSFPAIKAEMEAAQQEEAEGDMMVDHLFEIPLKVAHSLVGFKHDEDFSHVNEGFETLARPGEFSGFSFGGWVKKLFGR